MELKNSDRMEKTSEEMDNKFEVVLKEIKSSKSISTVTNPRSDVNEIQDSQPSGSKIILSTRVQASNNENLDSENDGFPLRASKMKDLKHPAKPLYRKESVVDVTIFSNEESDEEDHHMVTGANRQLHRQCNGCLIPSIDQTLRRPEFGARHCGSLPNTACFLD